MSKPSPTAPERTKQIFLFAAREEANASAEIHRRPWDAMSLLFRTREKARLDDVNITLDLFAVFWDVVLVLRYLCSS